MYVWLLLFGALSCHGQNREVSDLTCTQLAWQIKDGTRTCGSSRNAGECALPSNESAAARFCKSQGARLCRIEEIRRGAVTGTGCNADRRRIWSSTSCGDARHFTMAGGGVDLSNLIPEACVDVTASSDGVNDVYARCCADEPVPQSTDLSVSTCDDLGWPIQNTSCTKGILGGVCLPDMTYYQAWQTCDSLEARLCTEQEIKKGILVGAECDLESAFVWTSTICPGTNFVKSMGGSLWQLSVFPESCSYRNELRRVACCADTVTASPTALHTRLVLLPTTQPTDSPTTQAPPTQSPTSSPTPPPPTKPRATRRPTLSFISPPSLAPSTLAPSSSSSTPFVPIQNRVLGLPTTNTAPPTLRPSLPLAAAVTAATAAANTLKPTRPGKRPKAKTLTPSLPTLFPTATLAPTALPILPPTLIVPVSSQRVVVSGGAGAGGGKRGKMNSASATKSPTTSLTSPTSPIFVVFPPDRVVTPTSGKSPSVAPTAVPPIFIALAPTGKGGKVRTAIPTPFTIATETPTREPTLFVPSALVPVPSTLTSFPTSQNTFSFAPTPPSTTSILPSVLTNVANQTRDADNQTIESRVAFDLNYINTFSSSNIVDFRPLHSFVANNTSSTSPSSSRNNSNSSAAPPLTNSRHDNFVKSFRDEFARAVGISQSRIAVVRLSPGSIVTDFEIFPAGRGSSEPTALQANNAMKSLVSNTSSSLYTTDFALFSRAVPSSYESRSVQEASPAPTTARGIEAPAPTDDSVANPLLYLLLLLLLPVCCLLCLCCFPGKRLCWACRSCRKRCCRDEKVPVEFDAGPSKIKASGPELLHIRKPSGNTPKGSDALQMESAPLVGRAASERPPRFDSNTEYYDKNLGPDEPVLDGLQARTSPHLQGDAFNAFASPKQQAYQQQLLQHQQTPLLPVFHGGLGASPSHFSTNNHHLLQTPHGQRGISSPNFSAAKTPRPNTLFPPLACSGASSSPRTPRGTSAFSNAAHSSPASPPIFSPKKTPRSPGSTMIRETIPQVEYFTGEGETDPSLAISLFVFPGKDPEDLPLEQGQKIKVITRTPPNYEGDDWWSGELEDGQQGVFPRIWVLAIGDPVETCGLPNPALNDQLGKIVAIDFERQEVMVKIPHHEPQFFPTTNLKLVTESSPDD